jgi:hypothetical protein
MSIGKRRSARSGRAPLPSPGRPPVAGRNEQNRFWRAIAAGLSSEDAAFEARVSQPVGTRWFRRRAVCHQRCSDPRQSRSPGATCHWWSARRLRFSRCRVIPSGKLGAVSGGVPQGIEPFLVSPHHSTAGCDRTARTAASCGLPQSSGSGGAGSSGRSSARPGRNS